MRVGNDVYGIDQYRELFYRPDIVEARLAGDYTAGGAITIQQIATRVPPKVNIAFPGNFSTVDSPEMNLQVTIEDQNQPIQQVKILVNGRSVGQEEMQGFRSTRDIIIEEASIAVKGSQKSVSLDFPLTLDPGNNLIEVVAFNGFSWSNRVSVTVMNTSTRSTPLPNLWILAIGVNNYNDSAIKDLNFCVRDATEFVNTLKRQEGIQYTKVNSLLLTDGASLAPTAANIKRNLNFFAQAAPRDVIMLFLAGHGVSDKNGKFVFLPQDASFDRQGNPVSSRTINIDEILPVLNRPCHGIVFIDACHSGGITDGTKAVNNNALIRALMESDAYIFTASRGSEFSLEMENLKHGVFTYSILLGLNGEAAVSDNTITMKQLDAFVTKEVQRLTGNRQNPTGTGISFVDIILAQIRN